MPKMDLSKYGIKNVKEVLYNPSTRLESMKRPNPGERGTRKGRLPNDVPCM